MTWSVARGASREHCQGKRAESRSYHANLSISTPHPLKTCLPRGQKTSRLLNFLSPAHLLTELGTRTCESGRQPKPSALESTEADMLACSPTSTFGTTRLSGCKPDVHQVVPNLEKKSKSGKYFLKSDRGAHGFRGLGLSDCGAAW